MPTPASSRNVTLTPWGSSDLPVLERSNTPQMTRFLGGSETPEQLAHRHARYLRLWKTGDARMFRIDLDGEPVGGIGYWRIERGEEHAYESGWSVESEHQGEGIATRALALCIEDARTHGDPDRSGLYAFPIPSNVASNRLCARAGFALLGTEAFEHPRAEPVSVNIWRLDLRG